MRSSVSNLNVKNRRGYLFVAVLLTSLVVSAMGLVALSAASLRTRSALDAADWASAQALAQSGIEDAIMAIDNDGNWRRDFAHNVEYPSPAITIGGGKVTWKLLDDDGNLNDDDSDFTRVVGIARVGRATAAESVRIMPTGGPLSCLESSLHCPGNMTLGAGVRFITNQQISSNGNINAGALLTSIQGSVQATGTATGSISGTVTQGAATRRMPGSSAFDYFLDNGTAINVTSLPLVSGAYSISKCVIGPQANPFGGRNPEGIYVINCGGQRVRIVDSRIIGTIVLVNPATNSSLEGNFRWDTAAANYPALLVSGSIEVRSSNLGLSESALSTNFNPAGIPYEGNEDADTSDTYPSEINGLVYISGTFNAPQDLIESSFRGVVLCGAITPNSSCRFTYRSMFLDYPPPGFASGNPMRVAPGTRRREMLP